MTAWIRITKEDNRDGRKYYLCECSCGKQVETRSDSYKTLLEFRHKQFYCDKCFKENHQLPSDKFKWVADLPYAISSEGEVWSARTKKYLKPVIGPGGLVVYKLGGKEQIKYLHKTVAEMFIPNPENKPLVKNISGDVYDCSVSNLDWGYPDKQDVTGQRFGYLVAEYWQYRKSKDNKPSAWHCLCDCGNTVDVTTADLTRGHTKSCGCYRDEIAAIRSTTHGRKFTTEYSSWQAMKTRCYNENQIQFSSYGGRGIGVCETWLNSFEQFFEDMGEKPDPSYTLDRIDVNGGYSKENCRWTDRNTQAFNQRKRITNISGRTGVHKQGSKYRVNFGAKYIGIFEEYELACFIREELELKHYGIIKE